MGELMRQRLRTSADKTLYNAPANAANGVWDPQEREEIRASAVCRDAGTVVAKDAGSVRLQPQTAAPAGSGTETDAGPLKPRGEETRAMEFTLWERLAELPRRTEPYAPGLSATPTTATFARLNQVRQAAGG